MHHFSKTIVYLHKEGFRIHYLLVGELAHCGKVLVHYSVLHSLDGSLFQLVGVLAEGGDIVKLAPLAEGSRPCEDSSNGVCGGLFALEVVVVVTRYRAVSGLVLVNAVGGNKYRGHKSQRTESRRQHIGHNVAVVVLARPNEATLGADHTRYNVVYQSIEVFDTRSLKPGLIVSLVDLRENVLEAVVVGLGNGIL